MTRHAMTIGEERVAFFYIVGETIIAWAQIEVEIYSIVTLSIESDGEDMNWPLIATGFLSIESFRGKMDFAEKLVAQRYPEHKDEWLAMVKGARALSRKRNWLAHWRLYIANHNAPGRRYLLAPWLNKLAAPGSKRLFLPDGAISLRDIKKYEIEFTSFSIRLRNFGARLQGFPEPHPEFPEQPIPPPTIQALRAQIRAELADPSAPSEK